MDIMANIITMNRENYFGQATYYQIEANAAAWMTANVNPTTGGELNKPFVNGSILIVFKTAGTGIDTYMFSEELNKWHRL